MHIQLVSRLARKGSREFCARLEMGDRVDERLAAFVAERDGFYLGSASSDGQPYIQHRGGPAGFLHVIDDRTLAFADFRGNRQFISTGNFSENPKAFVFLMDYARRRRVKLWGRVRVVGDDPALIQRLFPQGYRANADQTMTPPNAVVSIPDDETMNCQIPPFITLNEKLNFALPDSIPLYGLR